MELLLVRHALPIRRELESGAADPELSEAGHAQAAHLARYLASEHLDAVYASTMNRARQTAEPIVVDRDVDLVLSDGITEYDRFSSEYIPVEELKASGLAGLGGAGFPTGIKWEAVAREPGTRYVVVNADEGEPGTIKDRYVMELRPHLMLEGMLVAMRFAEATDGYRRTAGFALAALADGTSLADRTF
mgnify:CR=1 FL=1